MNSTVKKTLFILFNLNILLSIKPAKAIITIKTSWSNLKLQIASDETVERSFVLGTPSDGPRFFTQIPNFEDPNVVITDTKPYTIYHGKKKMVYVSICLQGAGRSKQITIPVADGATLWVSYINEGEIAIDRPIDLINNTNLTVLALLNRHEPEYGFVRKYYPLQDDEEPFNYQPLSGERSIIGQVVKLAPAKIPFANGCLSQVDKDSLIYRLYTIRHRFMTNTYSQALDFALKKGLLNARWQQQETQQYTTRLNVQDLLPLKGERDVIEFTNQPQECIEEAPQVSVVRMPEAIEESNRRCGIFKIKGDPLQQGAPYLTIHHGASSPQL